MTGFGRNLLYESSDSGVHRLFKNRYCCGEVSGCLPGCRRECWLPGSVHVLGGMESGKVSVSIFLHDVPLSISLALHVLLLRVLSSFLPLSFPPNVSSLALCLSCLSFVKRVHHNAAPESLQQTSLSTSRLLMPALARFPFCGTCRECKCRPFLSLSPSSFHIASLVCSVLCFPSLLLFFLFSYLYTHTQKQMATPSPGRSDSATANGKPPLADTKLSNLDALYKQRVTVRFSSGERSELHEANDGHGHFIQVLRAAHGLVSSRDRKTIHF
jgi:hypothetical protein